LTSFNWKRLQQCIFQTKLLLFKIEIIITKKASETIGKQFFFATDSDDSIETDTGVEFSVAQLAA